MTNDRTSLSAPTPHDIESYIGTLETSYTYDPSERWRHAYDSLRALRPRFHAARAPYVWLSLAAFPITLACIAALLFNANTLMGPVDYFIFPALFIVPLVFETVATRLARRHEPLLVYEGRIDNACGKFDRAIAEQNNANA